VIAYQKSGPKKHPFTEKNWNHHFSEIHPPGDKMKAGNLRLYKIEHPARKGFFLTA